MALNFTVSPDLVVNFTTAGFATVLVASNRTVFFDIEFLICDKQYGTFKLLHLGFYLSESHSFRKNV